MIGTLLNAAAIVAGGALGLSLARDLSSLNQSRLKVLLGAFTVYAGLSMAWEGFSGSFGHRLAQFGIALLSLSLGNLTGQLLRLQRRVNKLGRIAQEKLNNRVPGQKSRFADGFLTCTLLFCSAPLAILGALQDGLLGSARVLAVKSALDGLATMAFARLFGWSVMVAAVPVLAFQGTITLAGQFAEPHFREPALIQGLNLTAGFLVCSVALVILELKKVALANYLPSLVYAPFFTWLFFH